MTVMSSPFEFREWVRSKASPYSTFAAKTPIDTLIPALQKIFYIQRHDANVPRSRTLSELKGVPVVKFKDNPWCVVYWSVGRSTLLSRDCRSLSQTLNTQVLNLMEKGTTPGTEWSFHENFEELEGADWMHDNTIYFRSQFKGRPNFERVKASEVPSLIDRTVDELLCEQGIEITGLDLDLSDPRIERVDLLGIPEFPLGMKEFQNWMYEGHPEYAVFAVKAPIDQVVQTLTDQSKIKDWEKQIEGEGSIWSTLSGKFSQGFPIIQLKDNPWTVVYWNVGGWTDLSDLCKACSSQLKAKVIAFEEEDTSAAFGYQIYENGTEIEQFEYFEELFFKSEIREEPEFDDFTISEHDTMNGFINQVFIEEGIYIPNWDLPISDPNLERVDRVLRS